MFQTFDHAKIFLPYSGSDGSAWAYVELMINAEWFFADCYITEDGIKIRISYLLSNPIQLNELITNSNVSIIGVYIASPPYINNTDTWKMDQVLRITRAAVADEDKYQREIDIYELIDGGEYYSSGNIKSDSKVENIRVLFSM